jgi:hypothetical protein
VSTSENELDVLAHQQPEGDEPDPESGAVVPESPAETAVGPSKRAVPMPPDDRRCTAKNRQTGERCKQWARLPSSVCRYHGALALKGPASHFFKHGMYSKYLPLKLRHNFLAALGDPELENLRRQIALCQTRELELIQRLDTNESGASWKELGALFSELQRAIDRGEDADAKRAFDRIDEVLVKGLGDDRAWADVHENMEVRRRLVETERKRNEFLQGNVTPDMMAAFVARISILIGQEVKDRNVLSRISDGIRAAAFGDRYHEDVVTAEVVEANEQDDLEEKEMAAR